MDLLQKIHKVVTPGRMYYISFGRCGMKMENKNVLQHIARVMGNIGVILQSDLSKVRLITELRVFFENVSATYTGITSLVQSPTKYIFKRTYTGNMGKFGILTVDLNTFNCECDETNNWNSNSSIFELMKDGEIDYEIMEILMKKLNLD
jgi:hypothetical protein